MSAALKLTPADWLAIEREACGRSLATFVREAWHVIEPAQPYIHGWHIDAIAQHLEAVTAGHITRLYINVPPGTMKSLMVSVLWPAWEWGPAGHPAMRYVSTAHSDRLAVRDNLRCRRLIASRWYQERWPVALMGDQNAKTKFENTATGFREAMPFTSLTGSRGDRMLIDDPLSVDDAGSEARRESVNTTFLEAVPTRLNNPDKSAIVVIMQRLHDRDVIGTIQARELDYEALVLPMEFETDRRCRTSIGFTDPRTKDGELLFPERFPAEVLDRDRKALGSYAWAGQMQQRPAPREGGMFKRSWLGSVRAIPEGTRFVRGWDLAATAKSDAAYTAGVKIGKTKAGRYVIASVARDQLSAGGVVRLMRATAESDGRGCRISFPQDPGQAGKAQAQFLARELAGFSARATPETGDKATRAEPLSAQAEAGNVDILRTGDPVRDSWIEPFLDELGVFPNGKYMDQVDAASRAFNELANERRTTVTTRPVAGLI